MGTYGIGAVLRAERVRQGLSIEDIARKTKISPRFLKSLEDEDFDSLPGLVFARGFLRQYSSLLNLDTEDLLSKIPKADTGNLQLPDIDMRKRVLDAQQAAAKTEFEWDPRWNSIVASLLWIGLGLSAAVGAYVYFNRQNSPVVTTQNREPAKVAEAPAPAPQPNAAQTLAASPAPTVPSTSTATSTPVAPTPGKPVQVVITATEPSWINVLADGKSAYTGILVANDSKTVEAASLVKLTSGNAGGVKVSLNGKELDSLGPHGQVRTVRITAAGLQIPPKPQIAPPDPL